MLIESIQYTESSFSFEVEIKNKPLLTINFNRKIETRLIGDCVLLLVLLQAMKDGSDIFIPQEYPVTDALLGNVKTLQEIFSRWYPKLSTIKITTQSQTPLKPNNEIISFFSGGVDSFYTFLKKERDITDCFLCIGLDIQLWEHEKAEKTIMYYQKLSMNYNKKLLVATTNIREVFSDFNPSIQTSMVLTGLALMSGGKRILIPATNSVEELIILGTHPLTDPLFSNTTTIVEHHGAVKRVEKMEFLSAFPLAIDNLRVCNTSSEFNCGTCEKCLRTMFALEVLEIQSKMLPNIVDNMESLKKLKLYSSAHLLEWSGNLKLSNKYQNKKLSVLASKMIFNYNFKEWLKKGILLFKQLIGIG